MKRNLIIAFLFMAASSMAQNIKTSVIEWRSAEMLVVETGETIEGGTKITSTNTSGLQWIKPEGTIETFTVGDVSGQWTNIASNGSVDYEITNSTYGGAATFTRTPEGLKVRLVLIDSAGKVNAYEFPVSDYQVH